MTKADAFPGVPETAGVTLPNVRSCRFRGRTLTAGDFETLISIKDSIAGGHDVEVRGSADGSLKVLEITRKRITAR